MSEEDVFLQELTFEDLKKRYKEAKKNLMKSLRKKHDQEYEERKKNLLKGIEEDKSHRMVLNACIFPFIESNVMKKLGYYFLRASPLSELKISNLDFLIVHPHEPKCAIFGEVKGNTADASGNVTQLKKRQISVEKNKRYVDTKYLNDSNYYLEYIMGVWWSDGNEMLKAVARKGGHFKVWNTGYQYSQGFQPELSLLRPGIQYGDAGKTMLHNDTKLNNALKKVNTSFDYKSIFPESHTYAKLALLTLVKEENGLFSYDELHEIVEDELDYLDDPEVSQVVDHILRVARDIGYLEYIEQEKKYKFNTNAKRADKKAEELKKKWIEFAIKKDEEKETDMEIGNLQEKFRKERANRKTLLDY